MKNAPPPAFQWYASDLMADETFLLATLATRGLYATLISHCWVNRSISANPPDIAKLLGLDTAEVNSLIQSQLIKKHFCVEDDRLICPDLERQRSELYERRRAQAEGGRIGGKKTQKKNRNNILTSLPSSLPSSSAKAPEMSRDELNRDDMRRVLHEGDISEEEWNQSNSH